MNLLAWDQLARLVGRLLPSSCYSHPALMFARLGLVGPALLCFAQHGMTLFLMPWRWATPATLLLRRNLLTVGGPLCELDRHSQRCLVVSRTTVNWFHSVRWSMRHGIADLCATGPCSPAPARCAWPAFPARRLSSSTRRARRKARLGLSVAGRHRTRHHAPRAAAGLLGVDCRGHFHLCSDACRP